MTKSEKISDIVSKESSEYESFEKFSPEEETVGEFLKRFKLFIYFKKNLSEVDKVVHLAKLLPLQVLNNLNKKILPKEVTDFKYDEIVAVLSEIYTIKTNLTQSAIEFQRRTRKSDENFESYATCLTELASKCNYDDSYIDRRKKEQFIAGLNHRVAVRLISEADDKTFNQVVELAKSIVQAELDIAHLVHPEAEVRYTAVEQVPQRKFQRQSRENVDRRQNKMCFRCGLTNHDESNCFKKTWKCYQCNKEGHIARMCKSQRKEFGQRNGQQFNRRNQRGENFRKFEAEEESEAEEEVNENEFIRVNRVKSWQPVVKKKREIVLKNRYQCLNNSECNMDNVNKVTKMDRQK